MSSLHKQKADYCIEDQLNCYLQTFSKQSLLFCPSGASGLLYNLSEPVGATRFSLAFISCRPVASATHSLVSWVCAEHCCCASIFSSPAAIPWPSNTFHYLGLNWPLLMPRGQGKATCKARFMWPPFVLQWSGALLKWWMTGLHTSPKGIKQPFLEDGVWRATKGPYVAVNLCLDGCTWLIKLKPGYAKMMVFYLRIIAALL